MKKGDILVSSWGYEQTNICFYEVVKTTAKTIELVKIKRKTTSTEYLQYTAMPIPGSGTEKPFRRRINKDSSVPSCKITDYEYAYLWDGRPMHGTSYA